MAALEAELEEVRAAVRRRDADAALNLRDGVALATGDAEARLAAALRERDAAQSLVATTRTERNITSERDALRKERRERPSDGADGASRLAADRDALEARVCARPWPRTQLLGATGGRRPRRRRRRRRTGPWRTSRARSGRGWTRCRARTRARPRRAARARPRRDGRRARPARRHEARADAAVARAIATMKGHAVEKARSDAQGARNRRGSGGRGRRARGRRTSRRRSTTPSSSKTLRAEASASCDGEAEARAASLELENGSTGPPQDGLGRGARRRAPTTCVEINHVSGHVRAWKEEEEDFDGMAGRARKF